MSRQKGVRVQFKLTKRQVEQLQPIIEVANTMGGGFCVVAQVVLDGAFPNYGRPGAKVQARLVNRAVYRRLKGALLRAGLVQRWP